MHPYAGPMARRASSLGCALLLTLAMAATVSAQDDPPAPPSEPTASPEMAEAGAALTLGPWHRATIDEAPAGHFVRGVASGELGTIALGNRELDGAATPMVWVSEDGMSFERATFAKGARKGLPEAAAATPDGWVAVGRGFPERAYAWTSPDGHHWKAARKVESAKGHLFYDVAVTPIGLVAVGCEAEFHCRTGKAWISPDGRTWKVLAELPIQLPKAITVVGDRIVVAGFSNAFESYLSHAVTASSKDGRKWTLGDLNGPQGSGFQNADGRAGEAFAIGSHLGERANDDVALLAQTGNGRAWSPIEGADFEGWNGVGVAAMDELVLLVGSANFDDVIAPVTYSSADLATWAPGTFTEGLRGSVYHVMDTAFTHDGSRALMVGAIDYAPGIWWADVAPVGSAAAEPAPMEAIGPVTAERFVAATVPEGGEGVAVKSVISGGLGYIAVGGGSVDGAEAQALAWTSVDGRSWDAAMLTDDAVNGVIEDVAPLPGTGYVAVGNDSTTAQAFVWHSADGNSWARADSPESFAGAVVHDLAVTPEGVVAVGCEAYPDCRAGLVWSTLDGLTWELSEELPLTPFAAAAFGGSITTGGTDSGKPDQGRAIIATSDAGSWQITDPLGKASSQVVAMDADEQGIVAAGWQRLPGKPVESALFVSLDGEEWNRVSHKRLKGMTVADIGLTDDGVLLTGTKTDKKTGTVPLAFWTRDLQEFETVRFPKDVQIEGLAIEGGGMAADGSMAFAAGTSGDRPAIWFSLIE